jgi:hypothetical protein
MIKAENKYERKEYKREYLCKFVLLLFLNHFIDKKNRKILKWYKPF